MKQTAVLQIDAFTTQPGEKKITVFKNEKNTHLSVSTKEYDLRTSLVLTFDGEGKLIEAGNNLLCNTETNIYGSPQLAVMIPAGGFSVFFDNNQPELCKIYQLAMEDAVLYCATMSVIYPVFGKIEGNILTIRYDDTPVRSGERWLFIGNSNTYFNGTPIKFEGLCKAAGHDIAPIYCTFGAAYWHEYADEANERGQFFRKRMTEGTYDKVVVQDCVGVPYEKSKEQFEILLPYLKKSCKEILLYMPYASTYDFANRPAQAETLRDIYNKLAKEYGLKCAPIAMAYLLCATRHPEISLYADDQAHHSKEGSYLIACVWLKAFLGIEPVGNLYEAELPKDIVLKLQKIASESVEINNRR